MTDNSVVLDHPPLTLTLLPEYTTLLADEKGQCLASLLLRLSSTDGTTTTTTTPPPLDVVVVVDRSESMCQSVATEASKSRITVAKGVVQAVVSTLRPKHDRVGLITFGTVAMVRAPLGPSNDPSLHLALDALDNYFLEGETNMGMALDTAARLFGPGRLDRLRVVLLVTDGDANVGRVARSSLVDGTDWPDDILLYTIGVGRGQTGELLSALAHKGHGQYLYIKEATEDALARAMATILGRLRTVVATQVSVTLTLSFNEDDVVQWADIHPGSSTLSIIMPQRRTFFWSCLSQGETRDVWFQLRLQGHREPNEDGCIQIRPFGIKLSYHAMPAQPEDDTHTMKEYQTTSGPRFELYHRFPWLTKELDGKRALEKQVEVDQVRQRLQKAEALLLNGNETVDPDAQGREDKSSFSISSFLHKKNNNTTPGPEEYSLASQQLLVSQQQQRQDGCWTPQQAQVYEELSQVLQSQDERPRKRQKTTTSSASFYAELMDEVEGDSQAPLGKWAKTGTYEPEEQSQQVDWED